MKSQFSYGFPMKAPFSLNEITLKSRFWVKINQGRATPASTAARFSRGWSAHLGENQMLEDPQLDEYN